MNEINKSADAVLASLGLSTPAPADSEGNRLGQEDFLELLTTQLQNQDPLQPMQNGEFLSQIAQFSTVSGIQDLQSSFSGLASALYQNQALQASVLVGRSALVPSGLASLSADSSISGALDLRQSTSELMLEVADASGQIVKRLPLGPQASGTVAFQWNGLKDDGGAAAPGSYSLRATALVEGERVAVETLVAARVDSVTLGGAGQGLTLNLAGMGAVDLTQIKQIM